MAIINPFSQIQIVLVDKNDKMLGLKEKYATHKIPVPLHRAISIVIFNRNKTEMLITKRAKTKPTWGGFWTNAVCSHPYPEETYQQAADRRLYEELGFKTPINEIFKFSYKAEMGKDVATGEKVWGEHELDHVFVGTYEGHISPNPAEVDGYEWILTKDLKKDVREKPGKYSPWFKIILKKLGI
ncbi:MAG TPA: isopentenyl-diphosphate Delta-isomerase [Patescibacteria group bacterium]|nr:isopentenyl-diphosphate Delta-isomerase [Patescibacteria group bacterium]